MQKSGGFIVELLVTNNNRKSEYDMLQRAKAVMAFGVAAVTCMNQEECREAYAGFENLCFVERHGQNSIRILDLIMNWQENGLLKK